MGWRGRPKRKEKIYIILFSLVWSFTLKKKKLEDCIVLEGTKERERDERSRWWQETRWWWKTITSSSKRPSWSSSFSSFTPSHRTRRSRKGTLSLSLYYSLLFLTHSITLFFLFSISRLVPYCSASSPRYANLFLFSL